MGLHVLLQQKLSAKLLGAQVTAERLLVARVSKFVGDKFVFEQEMLATNGALKL